MSTSAVPPRIPGSQILSSLDVKTAKIETLLGDILFKLNTWKGAATVASTSSVNLSTTLPTVMDGKTLVVGDVILLKDQSTASQNGLYTVLSLTRWERSPNLPINSEAAGVAVFVSEGTVNADTLFVCTTDAPSDVVGTNDLVFSNSGSFTKADGIVSGGAVTVNALSGTITSETVSLGVGSTETISVSNSSVLATSRVLLQLVSYGTQLNRIPILNVSTTSTGSFVVQITNNGTSALDTAYIFNYYVIV